MCVVSNLGDQARKDWQPWTAPVPGTFPNVQPGITLQPGITRAEFENLKTDVEEMHRLLLAAKEIDKRLGLADCEMEDKVEFLKKFAELLEVDLSDVFPT